MSTEHQQYSISNQADAIASYASANGYEIVRTYEDAGRSGLTLKHRDKLRQLIADVVAGHAPFRAVLVYDVSRWGRFQDLDEAAYYEYVCKSSGVPVHYCAESFANDKSMPDVIMKALKRTMAGEYSRELSVKVAAGLRRLAALGYRPGGRVVYGLRRQLIGTGGMPKQILDPGEWKSIATDRVINVRGPADECEIIRRVFREFADESRTTKEIAARLNSEGVPYLKGRWSSNAVLRTLRQTKYIGIQTWGTSTESLSTARRAISPERWVTAKCFDPIVSEDLFRRAQLRFASFTFRLTNEQLLEKLRPIMNENGRLTGKLIDHSRFCPSATAYYERFGPLRKLYAQLGIQADQRLEASSRKRHRLVLTREALARLVLDRFPGEFNLVRRSQRCRVRLKHRTSGLLISLVVGRWYQTTSGANRWAISVPNRERRSVALLVLLGEDNESVRSMWVMPHTRYSMTQFQVREDGEWLLKGERLQNIDSLIHAINRVRRKRR